MKNLTLAISVLALSVSTLFGQEYDQISAFGDYQRDLALVQKDRLYGFIDINGNEIIEPKHNEIPNEK